MSRSSVRRATGEWFTGTVEGLVTVYTAFPTQIPAAAFGPGPHGAVAVVRIAADSERRIAYGGEHDGRKETTHTVELQIFHRSVSGDGEAATDHLDTLLDSLRDRIRADRRFADASIFQAGEGQTPITGTYGEPKLNGSVIEQWCSLRFPVQEITQT